MQPANALWIHHEAPDLIDGRAHLKALFEFNRHFYAFPIWFAPDIRLWV